MKVALAALLLATPAVAESTLPTFDSTIVCGTSAPEVSSAADTDAYVQDCLGGERYFKKLVEPHWDALPAYVRETCARDAAANYQGPSYILLAICVHDVLAMEDLPVPFTFPF